ncbi:hypothetical protein [Nocardioides sp. CER19]|uniref:hypothetical protein n=1 Tax=Nocardioides sp. CER19 TaxID=3038538 RepID=UPI00244AAD9A|nr:hypothetical protein [Nocardioides sp. CER19]MDH2412808.1 hypothetical protein [Nocardioides sp. CER19]
MPDTPDEELVRRLLADARADEPMPADVAARLEGVLDDLAAERREQSAATPLRRAHPVGRRRRWATALVAAAAVVVGGVSLRALWPEGPGSSASDKSSSASSGGRAASPSAEQAVLPELHSATLEADVRRAVVVLPSTGAALSQPSAPPDFACAGADWGTGSVHPVMFDGRAAMLALRPPAHGRQKAEVLQCGTADVLASVTLPAR